MTQTNRSISSSKVCIRCGQDCSSRPRTKDLQGRYTCRECFDALEREGAGEAAAPAGVPVGASVNEVGGVNLGIEAEPELLAALLDEAVQQQALPPAIAPCPGCGHPLAAAAAICTGCGYNRATGGAVQTRKVEVVGGGPAGPRTERDRAREFEAREAQRIEQMEFIKPTVLFVAAVAGVCFFISANQNQIALTIPKYLAVYALSVVVAAAIYAGYCLAKIGFHASFVLSVLRLAAIVAACDLVRVPLLLFGGMGQFGEGAKTLVLPCGMCVVLLSYFLDLDILDAIFLGILLTAGLFSAGFLVTAGMGP